MTKFEKICLATGALVILAGIGLFFAIQGDESKKSSGFQIAVDDKGSIRLPDVDFRKDWTSLGSWAIAAKEGTQGSQGIHMVYTQPESVAAYRKTGKFPDGAVLIKELFSTSTDDMTTGTVSRAEKLSGWFVMIKDSKNRFPDNKLWGDGWGWAYFDAQDHKTTKTTDYLTECKGCHVPVQNSDWVYDQGYPVLKN